jgi:hypothetical protein
MKAWPISLACAATLSASPAFASTSFTPLIAMVWVLPAVFGALAAVIAHRLTRAFAGKVVRQGIGAFVFSLFAALIINESSMPGPVALCLIDYCGETGVVGALIVPLSFFLLVWALWWGCSRIATWFRDRADDARRNHYR